MDPVNHDGLNPRLDRSPPTAATFPAIAGFRIIREIGRGGMGVVYEAVEEVLNRRVALKVLPVNVLHRQKQVERFEREAKAAARLHHTNIVPVFGVGHQDGHHYYVMQYIEGQGLDAVRDELRRHREVASVAHQPTKAGPVNDPCRPEPADRVEAGTTPRDAVADAARSLVTGRFAAAEVLSSDATTTQGESGETVIFSPPAVPLSSGAADPSSFVLSELFRIVVALGVGAGRTSRAWPGSGSRWPRRWSMPIDRESCIATSSRRTCCSTVRETCG